MTPVPYLDRIPATITLVGSGFWAAAPVCRVMAGRSIIVPAVVHNDTAASCELPALENGVYEVELSNDGVYFSSPAASITVLGTRAHSWC